MAVDGIRVRARVSAVPAPGDMADVVREAGQIVVRLSREGEPAVRIRLLPAQAFWLAQKLYRYATASMGSGT
jgi:hypothetical protein